MPRHDHGIHPVIQHVRKRPLDWARRDDLWDPSPDWVPAVAENRRWLAVARLQWRVVQRVAAARLGRRHGTGTWLAERTGDKPSAVSNKLKGTYWLQPHDLLAWSIALPELDLLTVIEDDPDLPARWVALRGGGPRPARALVDDWQVVLTGVESWFNSVGAPDLVDEGALRLGLGEALIGAGVPVTRLLPRDIAGVRSVLDIQWASRLVTVGVVELTQAEHEASRWPAELRRLHVALAAVSEQPADDAVVLVAAGGRLLDQLPWSPPPTASTIVPARALIAAEELERLEVPHDGPVWVDVIARQDGRFRHLLLCRQVGGAET